MCGVDELVGAAALSKVKQPTLPLGIDLAARGRCCDVLS